jgi:hypothetical protein
MTDDQNDAVLETLKQIAAIQTELVRRVTGIEERLDHSAVRIEERLDRSNVRLRRIARRFRRWQDQERAMIADQAAAATDLPGSVPDGVRPLDNPVPLPNGEPLIAGAEHEAAQERRRGLGSAKQPPVSLKTDAPPG